MLISTLFVQIEFWNFVRFDDLVYGACGLLQRQIEDGQRWLCDVLQKQVEDARGFSKVIEIISQSVSSVYLLVLH